MKLAENAFAIAGRGLEGDRYEAGKGTFQKSGSTSVRQVSIISAEDIDAANATLARPFDWSETRRNIVVMNTDLEALKGMQFSIGAARMRWRSPCAPCERPATLAERHGFKKAYENRGGIRAEILASGDIEIGDAVSL